MDCGFLPVPVPNNTDIVERMVTTFDPAGIIFTGGNDLARYGGDAPERDKTEELLLQIAIEKDIPLYGFCRGMQLILNHYGCELSKISGHVAVEHVINGTIGNRTVNSFHNYGCTEKGDYVGNGTIEVLARAEDGVTEAIRVKDKRIFGTMWHPERSNSFQKEDIDFVKELFNK
mgnify:CR=1 FL=1